MIRRFLALAAATTLASALLAASASASTGSQTTLSITLTSKATPMAGAMVSVYWVPTPTGTKLTDPLIGSGVTSAGGSVTVTLNTSGIPAADLGDIGEGGNNAFNTEIYAVSPSGQYSHSNAVVVEAHAVHITSSAVTDPATGRAAVMSASDLRWFTARFDGPGIPMEQTEIGHIYRYSLVTPLNDAPGLSAVLAYTYDSSTTRQSEFELPVISAFGGVTLSNNQIEQTDRETHTGFRHNNGNFHRWIWANYYLVDWAIAVVHGGWTQWEPDHFQGTVSDYNPNKLTSKSRKAIGYVAYNQPKYNPGPGDNWAVAIGKNSLPWSRADGTRQENDITSTFTMGTLPSGLGGGKASIEDLMTYGSITSVTWTYVGGCGRGHTRVVWGYRNDPVDATRVMASCVPTRES